MIRKIGWGVGSLGLSAVGYVAGILLYIKVKDGLFDNLEWDEYEIDG